MILQHRAVLAVVAAAVLAVGAAFVFARPTYHPPRDTVTVFMARQPHVTATAARHAFTVNGIHLRLANVLSGVRFYGDVAPGSRDDGFGVALYPRRAKVVFDSTGPKPMFSTHFANVSISYGGHDTAFARRVEAAAAALRNG